MTRRSEAVSRLVELVRLRPRNLGDAFLQVGAIAAYWPQLRADERRRIKAAVAGFTGLVEHRRSRANGRTYGIYDSEKQGIESRKNSAHNSSDFDRGRWQLKWAVVCEEHGTCVCVSSLELARNTIAHPDFCEDCNDHS
jgi:hypothetical protein